MGGTRGGGEEERKIEMRETGRKKGREGESERVRGRAREVKVKPPLRFV